MSGRQHGGPRITGVIRIFPCMVACEVLPSRPCFDGCHPYRVPFKWMRRPCPLCPAGSVGRAVCVLWVMDATRTGCHWMPRRPVAKEGKPTLATIGPSRQACGAPYGRVPHSHPSSLLVVVATRTGCCPDRDKSRAATLLPLTCPAPGCGLIMPMHSAGWGFTGPSPWPLYTPGCSACGGPSGGPPHLSGWEKNSESFS